MNKIVIANLKMNLDYKEIIDYVAEIGNTIFDNIDLFIAPTSIYLGSFNGVKHKIIAQNVYCNDKGSYTGEISPKQLKSFGIDYSIIGHSERRNIFFENDMLINAKIKACLNNKVLPILCIGESLEEKDSAKMVIMDQLRRDLNEITNIGDIIIAYEPVWSIGTGIVPKLEEIESRISLIKELIFNKYKANVKVLYGGSVNVDNINEILNIKNVDGVLVGGSSINPIYFKEMLNKFKQ